MSFLEIARVALACLLVVALCLVLARGCGRAFVWLLSCLGEPCCSQCRGTGHMYDETGQAYLGPCPCGREE